MQKGRFFNMKKHTMTTRLLSLLIGLTVLLSLVSPVFAVTAPTGDLDGNGVLNVADILALKNLIMNSSWTDDDRAVADMNGDGSLNVADILIIKNRIMSGKTNVEPDDPPVELSEDVAITVMSQTATLATGENALTYTGLEAGDAVMFQSDYQYLWVQINKEMGETLIYTESGVFTFQVPKATDCYAANVFAGENEITARVATAEELSERRNLAVNAYDFKYADETTVYDAATEDLIFDSAAVEAGSVQAYPHAYANRVTENKTIFNARNAIDGVTATGNNHSNYPYQSWGCGRYDDTEFVLYFGREVELDALAFVLRADFSGSQEHDTYWESITAEFSDGTAQTFQTVKGGNKQSFTLDKPVKTTSVRLKNLVRHQNANSGMWAALTEFEAYGINTAAENTAAAKKTVTSDFGGKEIVETISDYSAAEIGETIDSVYRYFSKNIGVTDDGWKEGVYYIGLSDAYLTTGELDYYLDCRGAAESFGYLVNGGNLTDFGDDYCISQMYLTLNDLAPSSSKIESTLKNADYNISLGKLDYHWCDALFMSGMVFTELTNLTGDPVYSETEYATYLDWKAQLYSEADALWYRDLYWKGRNTTSGKPVFWSRGNAWVFAYLARQLAHITDTESEIYQTYLQDYRIMAASLKELQRTDGTWNPCLNDPTYFGGIETTGTGGFLYGFAIGVQLGLLDRTEYLPVALEAYDALTGLCMIEPGKIGYMEKEAAEPDKYVSEEYSRPLTNSFGTGLFLMGASALMRMCDDYEVPALEIPLDTQDQSFSRFAVEPGYYEGPIIASASSSQSGNEVEHLFDKDVTGAQGKRWSADGMHQWAIGDLGKDVALYKVCLYALQGRDYLYKIEVSQDKTKWVTVVDRSESNTLAAYYMDSFQPIWVRYVRLTICGAQTYGGPWTSVSELLLYEYTGDDEILNVDDIYSDPNEDVVFVPGTVTTTYSSNAPDAGYYVGDFTVTATSEEGGNEAFHLFDEKWSDATTGVRWSAMRYPQSATTDFGETLSISKLTMLIYQGRRYYYQLEVSLDGQDWQTISIVNDSYEGGENHTFTLSQPVDARYLRLTVTGSDPVNYSGEWISIKEILLYTAR